MKRPEGYSRPTAPPSGSRPTPPAASRPRASEPRPTNDRAQRPVHPPRPAAPGKPSGSRAREAEAELRAARRERKRAEKAELRRFTRRTRRRRIAWLTAGGLVVLLTGVLAIAVFSPLLALREIRIDGTSRLDPVALQAAVDGQLGTPLALLDDDRITRELGAFPLIRSYTTEVLPPGTLAIHIVERQPIGVVQSGARLRPGRSGRDRGGVDVGPPRGGPAHPAGRRGGRRQALPLDDRRAARPPSRGAHPGRHHHGDDEGRCDAHPGRQQSARRLGEFGTRVDEGGRTRLAPGDPRRGPARASTTSPRPAARCSEPTDDAPVFSRHAARRPGRGEAQPYRGDRNRLARNTLNLK